MVKFRARTYTKFQRRINNFRSIATISRLQIFNWKTEIDVHALHVFPASRWKSNSELKLYRMIPEAGGNCKSFLSEDTKKLIGERVERHIGDYLFSITLFFRCNGAISSCTCIFLWKPENFLDKSIHAEQIVSWQSSPDTVFSFFLFQLFLALPKKITSFYNQPVYWSSTSKNLKSCQMYGCLWFH